MVIVHRTILDDEMFPIRDDNTWVYEVQQWIVADALSCATTRVCHVYHVSHPYTRAKELVPWRDIARVANLPLEQFPDAAMARRALVETLRQSHICQRQYYRMHLGRTLQQMEILARKYMPDDNEYQHQDLA
jgi:hypothetical protein